ncbi:Tmem70 protein family [Popillia japonica]|uniref:Tmem70 protein family n=1 Tax=Popillia japonica TaxID=7064 RepID=A0AAW1KHQ0_POPJA
MNGRTILRVAPRIIEQYKSNKLLENRTYFCAASSHAVNKFTNFIQTRSILQDASKHEIAEGRERLYYGILTPHIRAVKWFSLTTSAASILAQPFLINTLYANNNVALLIAACSFIGFFTFGTPLLLHFITKKYVTHLDYDSSKKTYIASTVSFFCMLKETEFTPEDVKIPEVPGMFTTFIAKGKAMFLEPRFFNDPSHYAKIMGYDKPMDFKMFSNEKEEKK